MTRVINLIGGSGVGKSTIAAALFSDLKSRHISAELVTEFAKDIVYTNPNILKVQPYIFGEQLWRIERLINKVDYIITDSPLILSVIYNQGRYPLSFEMAVISIFKSFNNINFLIQNRRQTYSQEGRVHTLEESIQVENDLILLLDRIKIKYNVVRNDDKLVKIIKKIRFQL